jgi:hypothetical protein
MPARVQRCACVCNDAHGSRSSSTAALHAPSARHAQHRARQPTCRRPVSTARPLFRLERPPIAPWPARRPITSTRWRPSSPRSSSRRHASGTSARRSRPRSPASIRCGCPASLATRRAVGRNLPRSTRARETDLPTKRTAQPCAEPRSSALSSRWPIQMPITYGVLSCTCTHANATCACAHV